MKKFLVGLLAIVLTPVLLPLAFIFVIGSMIYTLGEDIVIRFSL